jgi:hypothetical protein
MSQSFQGIARAVADDICHHGAVTISTVVDAARKIMIASLNEPTNMPAAKMRIQSTTLKLKNRRVAASHGLSRCSLSSILRARSSFPLPDAFLFTVGAHS